MRHKQYFAKPNAMNATEPTPSMLASCPHTSAILGKHLPTPLIAMTFAFLEPVKARLPAYPIAMGQAGFAEHCASYLRTATKDYSSVIFGALGVGWLELAIELFKLTIRRLESRDIAKVYSQIRLELCNAIRCDETKIGHPTDAIRAIATFEWETAKNLLGPSTIGNSLFRATNTRTIVALSATYSIHGRYHKFRELAHEVARAPHWHHGTVDHLPHIDEAADVLNFPELKDAAKNAFILQLNPDGFQKESSRRQAESDCELLRQREEQCRM